MNGMRTMSSHRAREKKISKCLIGAFALILFMGLFSQITMLARISGQTKQIQRVERNMRELSASEDNLNLSLNQFHNLDRIAARAQQLGMEQPNETQIRVVSLPVTIESTSTQSAENIGAEEIMQ